LIPWSNYSIQFLLLEPYHTYFSDTCVGLTFSQLYSSNVIFQEELCIYIVTSETSVRRQGVINPPKTEVIVINLQTFRSYLTGSTLRVRYRINWSVLLRRKKSPFIMRTKRNIRIHSVGRMQSFSTLILSGKTISNWVRFPTLTKL
jgi:hypothetical protein